MPNCAKRLTRIANYLAVFVFCLLAMEHIYFFGISRPWKDGPLLGGLALAFLVNAWLVVPAKRTARIAMIVVNLAIAAAGGFLTLVGLMVDPVGLLLGTLALVPAIATVFVCIRPSAQPRPA
jgi:hypothetical protein